jgi:hypothetical protein
MSAATISIGFVGRGGSALHPFVFCPYGLNKILAKSLSLVNLFLSVSTIQQRSKSVDVSKVRVE